MISADYRVCLDACVLANQSVADLLFRLAERPRLYSPIFSEQILDEVRHTHLEKLPRRWPEDLADYWQAEVRRAFPEAIVTGHEKLMPLLNVDPDDQHVLAAAIRGEARLIVTFNLKDFPADGLREWDVEAVHLQDYLVTLYDMRPDVVLSKIYAIATKCGQEPLERLVVLRKSVPQFAEHVATSLDWELPPRAQR
ncbi:MAG: PIN domain-containing protein [Opitutales bacterium]